MGEGLIVRRGGSGKPEGANVWIVKDLKHQYSAEIAAYTTLSTSTGCSRFKIKEAVQGETVIVYYGNSYTYDQSTGQFTIEAPAVTTFELSETGTTITVGQYFTIGSQTAEVMYDLSGSYSAVFVYDEGYLLAKYNSSSGSLKLTKHFALQYTDTENPRYLVANNEDKFPSDGILDEKKYYIYENENIHGRRFETDYAKISTAEIDGKLYYVTTVFANEDLKETYLTDEGIVTNSYPTTNTVKGLCKHKNKIYMLASSDCLCFDPITKTLTTVGVLGDTAYDTATSNIMSINDVLYAFGSSDSSCNTRQYISYDDGITWTRVDTSDELKFFWTTWGAYSIQFVACGNSFTAGGHDGSSTGSNLIMIFDAFNKKFMIISNLALPYKKQYGSIACKGDTDTVYYAPESRKELYKLDWNTFTWTAIKTFDSAQYSTVLFNNRYATMGSDGTEYILEDALI